MQACGCSLCGSFIPQHFSSSSLFSCPLDTQIHGGRRLWLLLKEFDSGLWLLRASHNCCFLCLLLFSWLFAWSVVARLVSRLVGWLVGEVPEGAWPWMPALVRWGEGASCRQLVVAARVVYHHCLHTGLWYGVPLSQHSTTYVPPTTHYCPPTSALFPPHRHSHQHQSGLPPHCCLTLNIGHPSKPKEPKDILSKLDISFHSTWLEDSSIFGINPEKTRTQCCW